MTKWKRLRKLREKKKIWGRSTKTKSWKRRGKTNRTRKDF